MRWVVAVLVSAFGLVAGAADAYAAQVVVDPGGYAGAWRVEGLTTRIIGPETVEVPEGEHTLWIGETHPVPFVVDEAGQVVVEGTAATGGARLVLRTVPVVLDPGRYRGEISLGWASAGRWFQGRTVVQLVPGGTYHLDIGNFNGLDLELTADGAVRIAEADTAKGESSGGTLSLRTTPLYLDIGAFDGCSSWDRGPDCTPGSRYVELVPDGGYRFTAGGWNRFLVRLDAEGLPRIDEADAAKAIVTDGMVQIQTVPVTVDPGDFSGPFSFEYGSRWWTGRQTLDLVPGGFYAFNAGGWNAIFVHVDDAGQVTVRSPFPERMDTAKVDAEGSTVTFRTVPVTVDVGHYTGLLGLASGAQWSGTKTLSLVPDGEYMLDIASANSLFFRVDAAGKVTVAPGDDPKADAVDGALLLLTEAIDVRPPARAAWKVDRLQTGNDWRTGPGSLHLVPGEYKLRTRKGPAASLEVQGAPCVATPSALVLDGLAFEVSCATPTPAQVPADGQPRQAGTTP